MSPSTVYDFMPGPPPPSKEPMLLGLANGEVFDASRPETWSGDFTPIARGLANVSRFAGQLVPYRDDRWNDNDPDPVRATFYSVAQHSLLVHDLLTVWGSPPELCLAGLVHDAHEGVYGDIPTPLKPVIGVAWHALTALFDVEVATRLGIDSDLFHHRDLKHADAVALFIEAARITSAPWPRPYDIPDGIRFPSCESDRAEVVWLNTLVHCTSQLEESAA